LITSDSYGVILAWFHNNLLILKEIESKTRQMKITCSKTAEAKPVMLLIITLENIEKED
jgi:hypothetical protein